MGNRGIGTALEKESPMNGSERSRSEGQPGEARRRRASDQEPEAASSTPRPSRTHSPRRRAFFRRFRRPLIGLGMIGAAAPMSSALEDDTSARRPSDGDEDSDTVAGADAEEALAGRIGEMRASGERNNVVLNAVERFDIARDLAEDIYDVAVEEGVEPRLAYGLVKTESTFREGAVSPVGARGLTQLMPRTARWLMPGTTSQDLHDRRTNLRLGFRYLDQLIRKYRGDVKLALTAYNRGPGTVDRVLARGGDPDNGYAGKVLAP
jgi:hypothetical protein